MSHWQIECQWSIWEIGGGNALISLQSTVKQEDDAPAVVWTNSGQLDQVKNYINTVQFLAQTDRFVSLDLNVS